MFISIIGMSGVGKSSWTRKLVEDHGFQSFCCDDLIEEKLTADLPKTGEHGTALVAKWLGFPYQTQFAKNQAKYLAAEAQVMNEIFESLINEKGNGTHAAQTKIVIDTSGSVIYTGSKICKMLTDLTTVVYLEIPLSQEEEMFRRYITNPKPVIWASHFNKLENETELQALNRCYKSLFRSRVAQYEKLATITIPYDLHSANSVNQSEFIKLLVQRK